MPGEQFVKTLDPVLKAKKRERALENIKKAHLACKEKKALKIEQLIQFVALNPFSTVKEACRIAGLGVSPTTRKLIHDVLSQPSVKDRIASYKQEFINPIVAADIGERYRTLAIQAVEKAQERLFSKDCKDNTLVEILRVCSQYLAPKNAAVNLIAGQGSLIGILSDLPSSAQEQLAKLPEKVIVPE